MACLLKYEIPPKIMFKEIRSVKLINKFKKSITSEIDRNIMIRSK